MIINEGTTHSKFIYVVSINILFGTSLSVLSSFTCPTHCKCNEAKGLTNCSSLQFTKVPSNLSQNTTDLQLGDNQMLSVSSEDFENLKLLRELNLKKNNLREIANFTFSNLTNLEKLVLRNNDLTILTADTFKGLTALLVLNLSNNKLVNFPALLQTCTPKLKRLYLGSNFISIVTKDSGNLTAMTRLGLANNRIHTIENGAFLNYPKLINLELKNNGLVNITHEFMSPSLGKLEKVDLSENRISHITQDAFHHLQRLTKLKLEYNPLEYLECDLFTPLVNLKSITLRQGSMESIAVNGNNCTNQWFEVCKRLHHVNQMRGEPIYEDRPITISDSSKTN
ncbi:leucine-rich repeat-containing protein 15-like [Anneissia japonica]|uniref:leucine-rich repeat-containing protein 15-like n=1 Tax=Anneissia japonica TaxID=1529436 RepID=UPI001425ACC4|nr:leucine-rich repeat-containing protein 15-like [Anneissia japonica]XP_033103007.1 leucine-rich repeat-containing protein 15-like [Anneissia japonica]XP_033103008.1 leucine-rich repeat-containing protein 15-like [Anneissia japonica]